MTDTQETRRVKFVGVAPAVADWVRDQLGLDPNTVSHVRIDLAADCAATIEVSLFLRTGELEALEINSLEVVTEPPAV